jgi:signal transduction histidine kinase/ligand-binding sensor domain-containing protein/ActR/RegA family two-component response regulator
LLWYLYIYLIFIMPTSSLAQTIALLFCAVVCQALTLNTYGREPNVAFTNLTFRDGLPIGEITCSVRDTNGIVWIAGNSGVSKFDGYKVEKVSGERATTLFADSRGLLWVGSESAGLHCYDPASQKRILTLDHLSGVDHNRLPHPSVTRIVEDQNNDLWIGTLAGLCRLEATRVSATNVQCKTTTYRPDPSDATALPEGHITSLLIDDTNQLWVGTAGRFLTRLESNGRAFATAWQASAGISALHKADETHLWVGTRGNGLFLFDTEDMTAREMSAGIASQEITSAVMSKNGQMWVGTTQGFYRFNEAEGLFTAYYHEAGNPYSIASDLITDLREDSTGILWISTHAGLSRFDTNRFWFEVFRYHPQKEGGLRNGSIQSMAKMANGSIAVGTTRGIDLLDKKTGKFVSMPAIAYDLPGTLPGVLTITQDGTLWVGTRSAGLVQFKRSQKRFHPYRHRFDDSSSLPAGAVSAITEDSAGNLWIGTNGGGMAKFDRKSGRFERVPTDPGRPGNASSYIRCITEDSHQRIWVGTVGTGMFRFDPATERFASWGTPENGLGTETVSAILETSDGNLWVGTEGKGAIKFDPLSKKVEHIDTTNSVLPHNSVMSIVEDKRGSLWLSTGNGLAQLSPQASNEMRVFTEADGLQSTLFHENAALVDDDGLLYFGGPSGFNIINPDYLPQSITPRQPVLTGMELFGEAVVPGNKSILKKPLRMTERVTLNYDPRNRLAFTFATLDYANPSYSRFRHRLNGYDKDWVYAAHERRASYFALEPGIYPFEVQSSFDGNHWSANSASIELEVIPVWYQRWWAKWSAGAAAISMTSLFLAWTLYFRPFRIRQRHQELEVHTKKAESELSKQLQRSMLIERTAEEMHGNSENSLGEAIRQLGEFFKVDRVHLHLFDQSSPDTLEFSNEHVRGFHVASVCEMEFPTIGLPFVQQTLESDKPITCLDVNRSLSIQQAAAELRNLGTRSLLAMRTAYGDEPNGIIILHQCDRVRRWQKDETEILKALAGQIGIAIAQIRLTERDKLQRMELEDAKSTAETARVEAESARQMAEKANLAKSEFLAKMTHELRTPLNAILGFAELIRRDSETTEHQRGTLDIIHNSGEHLLSIINDVLEMSKIEAGGVEMTNERFDFVEMLKSVHDMLDFKAEQKGLKLVFRKAGDLPRYIVSDKAKLRQVIINLLSNSLKFTETGTITLKIRCSMKPAGRAKLSFDVSDTGKGISEEELPKLFQKFVQTETGKGSSEGTGLGLTISRSFIQYMGGDISVTSEVNKGTTFNFHIFVDVCESQESAPAAAAPKHITGLAEGETPRKILIVDDQMVNRMLLMRILKPVGFELQEAENGRDALEKWVEFQPDMILMDQDMPEMNGMDATKAIHARTDSPPVIVALTAYAMEEARIEILAAGCDDFLSKPFKNDELFGLFERHLNVKYVYREDDDQAAVAAP